MLYIDRLDDIVVESALKSGFKIGLVTGIYLTISTIIFNKVVFGKKVNEES